MSTGSTASPESIVDQPNTDVLKQSLQSTLAEDIFLLGLKFQTYQKLIQKNQSMKMHA
jgi:hypothetical protein